MFCPDQILRENKNSEVLSSEQWSPFYGEAPADMGKSPGARRTEVLAQNLAQVGSFIKPGRLQRKWICREFFLSLLFFDYFQLLFP